MGCNIGVNMYNDSDNPEEGWTTRVGEPQGLERLQMVEGGKKGGLADFNQ